MIHPFQLKMDDTSPPSSHYRGPNMAKCRPDALYRRLASQRKPVHGEDFADRQHTLARVSRFSLLVSTGFSFLVTGLDGFRVLTRCAPRNPVTRGSRPLAHFDARGWRICCGVARGWRICGGVARACMGAWHHVLVTWVAVMLASLGRCYACILTGHEHCFRTDMWKYAGNLLVL